METLRIRTNEYELIVAVHGNYTLLVMQLPPEAITGSADVEEGAAMEVLVKP